MEVSSEHPAELVTVRVTSFGPAVVYKYDGFLRVETGGVVKFQFHEAMTPRLAEEESSR